ncbi:MAG: T9SS type A sorting domain-containing protein, partial [Bacteroidales bacterium]|nr:T9SS type A sorting domain-containing protein [Bacteroidales bacterium]
KIGPNWVNGIGDCQLGEGYLVKMFANGEIIYPSSSSFSCGDPFIDPRNEQNYNTVQIGDQCWMAENLNIGTMINGSEEMTDNGVIEKYCYDNDPSNCNEYGGLFQWNEMMEYTTQQSIQGICPDGWYIPTDDEWKILEGTVDSQFPVGDPIWDIVGWRGFDAGLNLKSISGWYSGGNGTDLYGFTALPGGFRTANSSFIFLTDECHFWSSSEINGDNARDRYLDHYNDDVYRGNGVKVLGFSVRCLKNETKSMRPEKISNPSDKSNHQNKKLKVTDVMSITHFIFNCGNPAEAVYAIYIEGLEAGDEIAAYDGTVMVGATKIVSQNSLENELPVFSTIIEGQGYNPGNPIILKVWDASTQTEVHFEYTMIDPYNEAYMETVYPEGDGLYSIINITKGSQGIDVIDNNFTVYPNPVNTNYLFIELEDFLNSNVNLSIINIYGELIYKTSLPKSEKKHKINVSDFQAGVYLIKLQTQKGTITKKISIIH